MVNEKNKSKKKNRTRPFHCPFLSSMNSNSPTNRWSGTEKDANTRKSKTTKWKHGKPSRLHVKKSPRFVAIAAALHRRHHNNETMICMRFGQSNWPCATWSFWMISYWCNWKWEKRYARSRVSFSVISLFALLPNYALGWYSR